MVRLGVVAVVLIVSLGSEVVARAQGSPAGELCLVSDRPDGTPTAEGLQFSGGAGDFVSQPFTLPEGTVIYETTFSPANEGNSRAALVEAPRSEGSGGGSLGTVIAGTVIELVGTKPIYDAGEFILEVHADGDWSVVLQF